MDVMKGAESDSDRALLAAADTMTNLSTPTSPHSELPHVRETKTESLETVVQVR